MTATLSASIDREKRTASVTHKVETKLRNNSNGASITITETSNARVFYKKTQNVQGNNMSLTVAEDFGTNTSVLSKGNTTLSFKDKPSVAGHFANAVMDGISSEGWDNHSLQPNYSKDLDDYLIAKGTLLVKYIPYISFVEDLLDKTADIRDLFIDKDKLRVTTTLPWTDLTPTASNNIRKMIKQDE